jgi:hypothetical protein
MATVDIVDIAGLVKRPVREELRKSISRITLESVMLLLRAALF